jgi:thiol-disulfide isomerase/thioredoxin
MVNLMRQSLRILGAAAAVLLAAGAAAQTAPGNAFPPLGAAGLEGAPLPDTAGKVVVVDFWASWCVPCRSSFPAYSRLQTEFAARGLVVIGISVDDSSAAAAAFVAKLKPSFATARDGQHKLVSVVQVPTMPTSYTIDRGGTVRFVHAGFHGADTERDLRREITALLEEKGGTP